MDALILIAGFVGVGASCYAIGYITAALEPVDAKDVPTAVTYVYKFAPQRVNRSEAVTYSGPHKF